MLEGAGCDVGQMVVDIFDSEGHQYLGPNCGKGNYFRIPKDGAYQLVINADNTPNVGPYHFVFQGGKLTN
jgi:hypothetical protein